MDMVEKLKLMCATAAGGCVPGTYTGRKEVFVVVPEEWGWPYVSDSLSTYPDRRRIPIGRSLGRAG